MQSILALPNYLSVERSKVMSTTFWILFGIGVFVVILVVDRTFVHWLSYILKKHDEKIDEELRR